MQGIVNKVLTDFAEKVSQTIPEDKNNVTSFFNKYFRFYAIEKELPDDANPILILTPYLDAIELQSSYTVEHEKYLETFFNRVNKTFLVQDGYSKDFVSYETLVEIAAKEFSNDSEYKTTKETRETNYYGSPQPKKKNDDAEAIKEDANLIGNLKKKYNDKFRAAHKYVAIVHSDGDNIGKIIKSLKLPEEFKDFSQKLGEYSRNAVKIIDEYGGMPIYAGGDDLLFFAPVVNDANPQIKHIIDLLDKLDSAFIALFIGYKTSPAPSLSFGVSISYYKYPLFEALEDSRGLLHEAKQGNKHNIALKVLKHSGHSFGETLHISNGGYFKHFKKMLDEHVTGETGMLSSIVYKIHENQKLFSLIGSDSMKVSNFIDNSFNERVHDELKPFLNNVKELIAEIFKDAADTKKALAQIYAILRTISFFIEKDAR